MVVHRSKNLDALDDMGRMYRPIQDLVQCQSLGYPELRSTHRNHKRDQPRLVLSEFRRPLLGQSVSTRRVSWGSASASTTHCVRVFDSKYPPATVFLCKEMVVEGSSKTTEVQKSSRGGSET